LSKNDNPATRQCLRGFSFKAVDFDSTQNTYIPPETAFLTPESSKPVDYGDLVQNLQSIVTQGFPGDQRRVCDGVCFGCFFVTKTNYLFGTAAVTH
jgi:hypothetical protein